MPFWRAVKLGEVPHLANLRRCCSVTARWLGSCTSLGSRHMKRLFLIAVIATLAACAAKVSYVAGTRIPYSQNNKSVLDAVEEYRLAVERGDAEALMLMAHKQYWEDSGHAVGQRRLRLRGPEATCCCTRLPAGDRHPLLGALHRRLPAVPGRAPARLPRGGRRADRRELHDRRTCWASPASRQARPEPAPPRVGRPALAVPLGDVAS